MISTDLDNVPVMLPPTDLDINKDFECLLIPTNTQIETMYDAYVDEITEPLNFEED